MTQPGWQSHIPPESSKRQRWLQIIALVVGVPVAFFLYDILMKILKSTL